MKKEWFIIRSDHHEGPYSVSELDAFFSKRKIDEKSLVWKEGIDEPISFSRFLNSSFEARSKNYQSNLVKTTIETVEEKVVLPFKAPQKNKVPKKERPKIVEPPKVDLPVKVKEPAKVIEEDTHKEKTEINLPEIVHIKPKKKKKKIEKLVIELPHEVPAPLREPSQFWNSFFDKLKLAIILGPIMVFIYIGGRLGFEFYDINMGSFSKPKLMKNEDYRRLVNSLIDDKISNFAVSKDSEIFWMAFNSVYEAKLQIQLRSPADRNLNLKELVIRGDGHFINKLGTFKNLSFEGSDKIIPGYYSIEIKNLSKDYTGYWISQLVNLNKIKDVLFEEVYLGNVSKEFYENKLKREIEKKSKFHQNFMLEIEQRRKTLKAILSQIEAEVKEIIAHAGKKKARRLIHNFKAEYIKTYGYFFSMFVQENQDFFNKVVNTTFDNKDQIISGFNNLAKIAKSSAENCSEILDIFKIEDKLSIKSSIKLENDILVKLNFYQKNL